MNSPTNKRLRIVIIFMYVVAIFWIVFGIGWLFRDSDYRYFYFAMAWGNAMVLAILAYFLSRRRVWAWWMSAIVMGANIILTITDQVGWFDLAYLIPALVLFILLLTLRSTVKKAPHVSYR